LNSEVAQTSDTLDCNQVTGERTLCRNALKVVIPAQSKGAASTALRLSGIAASASTGANMYSWYPPS
jgi:hypothetical protein